MKKHIAFGAGLLIMVAMLSGCETTNSVPYKASTENVIHLQQNLKQKNIKVRTGEFSLGQDANADLLCRLMGPVKVAPGKTLPQYIKDAFQEELFLAQVYASDADAIISASIDKLEFSSVSPAYWDIAMTVRSNYSDGYQVNTKYEFNTSFSAYSACQNVADAFSPAVQSLLKKVILSPNFPSLVGE